MARVGLVGERVWRLRKRQQSVDAILHGRTDGGVTLEYVYNGRRITRRVWATRDEAMSAATEKRRELERAGWAMHW